MSAKKSDQSLHEVIHAGNQCIKDADKQLSRLDKLRKTIALNRHASSQVVANISASDQTFLDAEKELQKLNLTPADKGNPKKQKQRKRLGRAVHRKLQI